MATVSTLTNPSTNMLLDTIDALALGQDELHGQTTLHGCGTFSIASAGAAWNTTGIMVNLDVVSLNPPFARTPQQKQARITASIFSHGAALNLMWALFLVDTPAIPSLAMTDLCTKTVGGGLPNYIRWVNTGRVAGHATGRVDLLNSGMTQVPAEQTSPLGTAANLALTTTTSCSLVFAAFYYSSADSASSFTYKLHFA